MKAYAKNDKTYKTIDADTKAIKSAYAKRKKVSKRKTAALPYLEKLTGGPLTFAELILILRENEDLTQKEFADRLGISKQKLCDLEKGRRDLSPARAAQFALKLGYPPELFVELVLRDSFKHEGLKIRMTVHAA